MVKSEVPNFLQLHQAFLLLLLPTVFGGSVELAQCRPDQQRQILDEMPGCKARPSLVDLRALIQSNLSLVEEDVVQVVPDHVSLPRCGGSCYSPSHSCSPTTMSWTSVDVMLVKSKWPHGEHEVLCTELQVEVHLECQCGCQVQEKHCRPHLQYYHPPSCRCICTNLEERSECLSTGRVWDPDSCSCHCPSHTWQPCSTGYMFDHGSSCTCVPTFAIASQGVIASLILISVLILVIIVGGITMFRTKTGLFKEREARKRTHFMTQNSVNDYDLVNSFRKGFDKNSLSVFEFDTKRNLIPNRVLCDSSDIK